MNLIIGIVIGIVLSLCACFLYFKIFKNHTDGIFEIQGSNYKLVLFDPIDDWEKKERLNIKVTHREDE